MQNLLITILTMLLTILPVISTAYQLLLRQRNSVNELAAAAGDFALRRSARLHKRRFKSHRELYVIDTLCICLKASLAWAGSFQCPFGCGGREIGWGRWMSPCFQSAPPTPRDDYFMTTKLVGDIINTNTEL